MKSSTKSHGSYLVGLFYVTGLALTVRLHDVYLICIYIMICAAIISTHAFVSPKSSIRLMLRVKRMNKACVAGLILAAFAYLRLQDTVGAVCIGIIFLTPSLVSNLSIHKDIPQELL